MRWKPFLITGLCCIGVGLGCTIAGAAMGAFSVSHYLERQNRIDRTDTITEPFSSVIIEVDNADVTVVPGDTAKVEATGVSESGYTVETTDDMLCITQSGEDKPWYQNIQIVFFNVPRPQITVTLPAEEYRLLGVSLDLGKCSVKDLGFHTVSIDVNCGDVMLSGVETSGCTVSCDLGDCSIEDSHIAGTFFGSMHSGSLTLQNLEIDGFCRLKNSLGDIQATDITAKNAEITLNSGDLSLRNFTQTDPNASTTLSCDLGDLELDDATLYHGAISIASGDFSVSNTALYGSSKIDVDLGDIALNLRGSSDDYEVIESIASGSSDLDTNRIAIQQNLGDVSVTFTEK